MWLVGGLGRNVLFSWNVCCVYDIDGMGKDCARGGGVMGGGHGRERGWQLHGDFGQKGEPNLTSKMSLGEIDICLKIDGHYSACT